MSGRLAVIGIGPGNPDQWTAEARAEIAAASDLFGYESYLARVPKAAHQAHHASDNRVERSRAEAALSLASSGQQVAMISGGDPGVFAMAPIRGGLYPRRYRDARGCRPHWGTART